MTLLEAFALFDRVAPVNWVCRPDEASLTGSPLFCCGRHVHLEFVRGRRRLRCAVCGTSVTGRAGEWELEEKDREEKDKEEKDKEEKAC